MIGPLGVPLRGLAYAQPILNFQSGRSFVRFGSAFRLLKPRSFCTSSASLCSRLVSRNPYQPDTTLASSRARNFRGASFSTMHRAPAAMVTKPMTDPNVSIQTPRDPNTLSNYHNFACKHVEADFEIDFDAKVLKGGVELRLESLTEAESGDISLDTRWVAQREALEQTSLRTWAHF